MCRQSQQYIGIGTSYTFSFWHNLIPYKMKQDEEVWVELQYYRDRKHMDEGLAGVLHDKMSQAPAPNCIVSEITITNPVTRHEGRKGAIFEYPEYAETVVIQD